MELVREHQLKTLEAQLSAAAKTARDCGVTTEELLNMLRILLEEESL